MMKTVTILAFLVVVYYVEASHFLAGNVADRVMPQIHEKVEYNAIPFIKRVKERFYNLQNKKIQGIQALDQLQGHASINITAGGVGFTYVNLRFKSDRGAGLDYDVGIYFINSSKWPQNWRIKLRGRKPTYRPYLASDGTGQQIRGRLDMGNVSFCDSPNQNGPIVLSAGRHKVPFDLDIYFQQ